MNEDVFDKKYVSTHTTDDYCKNHVHDFTCLPPQAIKLSAETEHAIAARKSEELTEVRWLHVHEGTSRM